MKTNVHSQIQQKPLFMSSEFYMGVLPARGLQNWALEGQISQEKAQLLSSQNQHCSLHILISLNNKGFPFYFTMSETQNLLLRMQIDKYFMGN